MNRSYQIYLQNRSSMFLKKVLALSGIFISLVILVYFVNRHFAHKNKIADDQRKKIEISSSKSAALGANKIALEKAFLDLNPGRKINKDNGRQYIIESLTKTASSLGVSNFVIENITQKNQTIERMYKDFSQNSNVELFEIELTFNSILNSQLMDFIQTLNKNINGVIVVHKIETKKIIEVVDSNVLESINTGQKISMLGNKLVLHWFFIK